MSGRALEFVDGATDGGGLCLGCSRTGDATGLRIVLIPDEGAGGGKFELLATGRVRFMMERESVDTADCIIFGTGGGGLGGGLCW